MSQTFEEWWEEREGISGRFLAGENNAKAAWDARVPEGYVVVPINELIRIEDAIAFELGGEPCGLYEAHKLIKAMIQVAQENNDEC